jgi:deoxyribose-phosphate aldolase
VPSTALPNAKTFHRPLEALAIGFDFGADLGQRCAEGRLVAIHSAGGASVEAVAAIAAVVEGRLGIKAAGGISDAERAKAMVRAGATRLGMSKSAKVLAEIS